MTTSPRDASKAAKQIKSGRTKAERSVAASDLAQAARRPSKPSARKPTRRTSR